MTAIEKELQEPSTGQIKIFSKYKWPKTNIKSHLVHGCCLAVEV
jgi:hypothetical protein